MHWQKSFLEAEYFARILLSWLQELFVLLFHHYFLRPKSWLLKSSNYTMACLAIFEPQFSENFMPKKLQNFSFTILSNVSMDLYCWKLILAVSVFPRPKIVAEKFGVLQLLEKHEIFSSATVWPDDPWQVSRWPSVSVLHD